MENIVETLAFETFKKLLHLFVEENFSSCSEFRNEILNSKDEQSIKKLFIRHNEDVFEALHGDFEAMNSEHENDIENLNNDIADLQEKVDEYEELTGSTINDNSKLEHFKQYRDDYQEWELEELLKNGRKYLTK